MPESPHQTRWLLLLIMAAIGGWGLFQAIGMLWGGDAVGRQAALRALIVLACVLGFLAAWVVALTLRERRIKRDQHKR